MNIIILKWVLTNFILLEVVQPDVTQTTVEMLQSDWAATIVVLHNRVSRGVSIEAGGCSRQKNGAAPDLTPPHLLRRISAPPPCSKKSTAHCPRKEQLLLFWNKAKNTLELLSSILVLLYVTRQSIYSYNNFYVYLLVNDNTMSDVVVCSPEQFIVLVL